MRIGYACINTRLPTSARTVRLANATPERLRELIASNLDALEAILRWNAEHDIRVFRVTSNLVPLASHSANTLAWWDEFGERLAEIGTLVRDEQLALSTHPGQYTVLGSARPEVVAAAVDEVEYHARLFDAMRLPDPHIVVHVTGTDDRFSRAFAQLSPGAQRRLVLENDERRSLADALVLAGRLGARVVFDPFHHSLNGSFDGEPTRELAVLASAGWDGRQEVHFSTQQAGKRPGAHADSLDLEAFAAFARDVADLPLDCVLEVKDKEQSALAALPLVRQLP
jgi:UV DNA damage endonuclease